MTALPEPDRVGQRPRGDLLLLEVGRDVDVGGGEELGELVLAHEAVVEDHVRVHAEPAGRGSPACSGRSRRGAP